MREIRKIYLGGCDVVWSDAEIQSTGAALDGDDAVVFNVYEAAADPLTDPALGTLVTGPTSMTYVSGSNGKFSGHLAASVALMLGDYYWLAVTATPAGGNPHTRYELCRAVRRGFNPWGGVVSG